MLVKYYFIAESLIHSISPKPSISHSYLPLSSSPRQHLFFNPDNDLTPFCIEGSIISLIKPPRQNSGRQADGYTLKFRFFSDSRSLNVEGVARLSALDPPSLPIRRFTSVGSVSLPLFSGVFSPSFTSIFLRWLSQPPHNNFAGS